MTLIPRQPRPLVRDTDSLRDDRLFIVACDDTFAPKQCFNFYRLPRIQVHVVPTVDGTSAAPHVLEPLLLVNHDPDDELWMLLDTDHCVQGPHLATFAQTLAEAERQGVSVALSKPSFERWLLLHHLDEAALGILPAARDAEQKYCSNNSRARFSPSGVSTTDFALPSGRRCSPWCAACP
jgi:hypothetical protein